MQGLSEKLWRESQTLRFFYNAIVQSSFAIDGSFVCSIGLRTCLHLDLKSQEHMICEFSQRTPVKSRISDISACLSSYQDECMKREEKLQRETLRFGSGAKACWISRWHAGNAGIGKVTYDTSSMLLPCPVIALTASIRKYIIHMFLVMCQCVTSFAFKKHWIWLLESCGDGRPNLHQLAEAGWRNKWGLLPKRRESRMRKGGENTKRTQVVNNRIVRLCKVWSGGPLSDYGNCSKSFDLNPNKKTPVQ